MAYDVNSHIFLYCFFFQAEDGIRDGHVTGVQTCALPIFTRDVPDYAMILGNPGRQKGWMSRHGHPLKEADSDGLMVCPESGFRYQLAGDTLLCLKIGRAHV